jgi:hypothetical protein
MKINLKITNLKTMKSQLETVGFESVEDCLNYINEHEKDKDVVVRHYEEGTKKRIRGGVVQ